MSDSSLTMIQAPSTPAYVPPLKPSADRASMETGNRKIKSKGLRATGPAPRRESQYQDSLNSSGKKPRLTLPAGFLEDLHGSSRSPRTKSAYISDLNDFLGWLSDRIPEGSKAPALQDLDLAGYQRHLVEERDLSPSTVNRRIASLRQLFAWFHDKGHLPRDPSRNLKWLTVDRPPPKQLVPHQYRALLAEARRQVEEPTRKNLKIRNAAIVELLLTLGLRVGELASLNLEDVILTPADARLYIRSTGGKREREIPIPKDVRVALDRWVAVRPRDSGPFLFVSQKRGALNPATVFRVISGLGKAVGLKLSPQVLRHTAATRLIQEAGADITDVASLLGHRSLEPASRYVMANSASLAGCLESLSAPVGLAD